MRTSIALQVGSSRSLSIISESVIIHKLRRLGLQMVGLLANIRHKAVESAPATAAPGGQHAPGALAASIMLPALLLPAPVSWLLPHLCARVHPSFDVNPTKLS